MNHFENSQKVRYEIKNSAEVMLALREHVHKRRKGHYLGQGECNIHYRIGQLPSGL